MKKIIILITLSILGILLVIFNNQVVRVKPTGYDSCEIQVDNYLLCGVTAETYITELWKIDEDGAQFPVEKYISNNYDVYSNENGLSYTISERVLEDAYIIDVIGYTEEYGNIPLIKDSHKSKFKLICLKTKFEGITCFTYVTKYEKKPIGYSIDVNNEKYYKFTKKGRNRQKIDKLISMLLVFIILGITVILSVLGSKWKCVSKNHFKNFFTNKIVNNKNSTLR